MSCIYGIFTALVLFVAWLLLCISLLLLAYVIYVIKDAARALRLNLSAKSHARVFGADILESHMSALKADVAEEGDAAKREVLQRLAATDQRFLSSLLQMTMRMIKSVRVQTIQKDAEEGFSLLHLFEWGTVHDVKQISVGGMPVGAMFKVTKNEKATVDTKGLIAITKLFTAGTLPGALLSALPESDKLISDGGVK